MNSQSLSCEHIKCCPAKTRYCICETSINNLFCKPDSFENLCTLKYSAVNKARKTKRRLQIVIVYPTTLEPLLNEYLIAVQCTDSHFGHHLENASFNTSSVLLINLKNQPSKVHVRSRSHKLSEINKLSISTNMIQRYDRNKKMDRKSFTVWKGNKL